MSRTKWTFGIVAAVLLIPVPAAASPPRADRSPPLAAGTIQVVTADAVIPHSDAGGGLAECPSNKVVFGGGVKNLEPGVRLRGSFPSGNGWGVRMENRTGSNIAVTVYAVCGFADNYSQVSEHTMRVPAFGTAGVSETCPAGTEVLGGGVDISGGERQIITESWPERRAWLNTVHNFEGFPVSISGWAICGSGFTTYDLWDGPVFNIPETTDHLAEVECPPGSDPIAGGAKVYSANALGFFTASYQVPARNWRVHMSTRGAPARVSVGARAICVRQ